MATLKDQLLPINIQAGVQPSTDRTALSTPHFTAADKIRFRFGYPQKIGGWAAVGFNNNAVILGYARTLFSTILTNAFNTIIGTNKKLYSLIGAALTNITPLQTSTTAIAASLATDFGTLGTNPFTTISGSTLVTVTDTNYSKYAVGDIITIASSSTFAGFSSGQINTAHTIHTIGAGTYTFLFSTAASTSTSGGGVSVSRATGRITVTAASHGQANGDRVKIAGAADTGGILAASINAEFIIRNVAAGTFDIVTAGVATSSVSGGGGASTTYQKEISSGNQNEAVGQGYGCGLYGVGLYGTALLSSTGIVYPRIWFVDRFGNNAIMTAGNQTGLYSWAGSTAVAPALVSNAPSAINYAFVSNNIVVTFGASNTANRIFSSDQGNSTQWSASSTNQVFDYTVNGAGRLKSHVPVNGGNLIFTDRQTYLFSYIGLPLVWSISQLENNIGIISPMARCSVNGTAYWMGQNNFYLWSGGNIEIIPANTQEYSTILNYVFDNLTSSQKSKIFCWYNEQFDEIWWHYPSAGSNECDRVARLNRSDLTWVPDTFDRTCAEYPNLIFGYPRLINSSSILYAHEQGVNDNGAAMPWSLTSNLRSAARQNNDSLGTKNTTNINGIVPDSVQVGDISVQLTCQQYPQSANPTFDEEFTITPTTDFIPTWANGRFWQYTLSGNEVDQSWIGGQWHEYLQQGAPQ